MMVWPLDNAEYTAEAIGAFAGTRTRGVFAAEDCFRVTSVRGFTVKLSGGLAWLKKEKYWGLAVMEPTDTQLTVEVGSGALSRYAAVCILLDKTANAARVELRYGEYSDRPVKPAPRRDAYFDEIIVATILQKAAAVEITPADITDERTNEDLCGLMRDGVTGIPLGGLLEQAQAEFDGWFARMQNQLSADAAGHLQVQVDQTNTELRKVKEEVDVFTATFRMGGAWHQSGDTWTQTAPCSGMKAAYDTGAPFVMLPGKSREDDDLMRDALSQLAEGRLETLDGNVKATLWYAPPNCDIEIYMRRVVKE